MIRRIRYWPWLALLFIACQWLAPTALAPLSTAQAAVPGVTCQATMTSINFGNVDPYNFGYGFLGLTGANYNLQTTGFLTYYCTNTTATARIITACFSIGNPGSGSATRSLTGPGSTPMSYNIYQDAANNIPWGSKSSTTWGTPLQVSNITVPANGTSPPMTQPVYATIDTNQGGSFLGIPLGHLPAGNYTANYGSGSDILMDTGLQSGGCAAASGGGTISSFNVSANVQQTCQVTTNPLIFLTPTNGDPSGTTATTTLTVTCTSHTGYQIGLDNGKNFDGANRRMRGGPTASNYISYGLYQPTAGTTSWGNTQGTNTVTGINNPQTFTVYGKINAGQGTVAPGDYFDAVTVYVYY